MAALAVARIALLSADVVVNSLPALPAPSPFEPAYAVQSPPPTLVSLPNGADPASVLLRYPHAALIAYTAVASPPLLTRITPHAPQLSALPLVLHIAVADDLTDPLALRFAFPYFFYSKNPQQAHDHALLAARIARSRATAVVHVFHTAADAIIDEIPADNVLPFLVASAPISSGYTNGHTNGHPNGHTNGHTNGYANGNGNGMPKANSAPAGSEGLETPPETDDDPAIASLFHEYRAAAASTSGLLNRPLPPTTSYGSTEPSTVIFTLGSPKVAENFALDDVSLVDFALVKPLPASAILGLIPESAKRVIILEQVHRWNMKWTPLMLEITSALQQREPETRPVLFSGSLGAIDILSRDLIESFLQKIDKADPATHLLLGPPPSQSTVDFVPYVPRHETSYTRLLQSLFPEHLHLANAPELVATLGEYATTPEFALARVQGHIHSREDLVQAVHALLASSQAPPPLHDLLSKWVLLKQDATRSRELGAQIVSALETSSIAHESAGRVLQLQSYFAAQSHWIIGSDAWSYDIGASGLHHLIASGLDVNILLLDTTPYSARNKADPNRRKQDAGLYAMNHGDVFVASVAVYSSYGQTLTALQEADNFTGPSVVLAYLPYHTEKDPALMVLKETKQAVDAGFWPLYRWNPAKEAQGQEPFLLDSDAVKNDLQAFLDRDNHLSQVVRSKPQIAAEIVTSLGETVKEARRQRAKKAYEQLLSNMGGPPLLVLYASDGGNAEKVAKRLGNRGKLRGLATTVATMDSTSLVDLAQEEYVVFITSTAGQGEPPQNGRTFFKALNAAAASATTSESRPLTKLRYSVFAMGDSHYWPRPEDKQYYNKPGKDLYARLQQLGGKTIAELGLGNDQDSDGWETGYKPWERLLWTALGVDSVEVTEKEPDPITNEHIKVASNYLRGTILEGLEDLSTGNLAPSDTQLTKFHGIYEQDDRDIRDERQAQGLPPAYGFMVRVRVPGGVCTPQQWLAIDQISDEHGSGTFKITTRQTFQFHGVIKRHLKPTIKAINRVLLDSLAACGDVNRNVLCSVLPGKSKLHAQVYQFSKSLSEHLLPRTTAYHEIWLDKKLVAGEALKDFEPLYGEFYLPRKFKIAVAVPPTNDVDLFTNDVGFIAIMDDNGELAGFNVTAGGGMGVTHGNKKTYPRLGTVLGFCTIEQGKEVAEAIMLTQRDNGNRADRKNARLKYTIDRMGLDKFKAEVELRMGFAFEPERPYTFDRNIDDFGWYTGEDGKHHFTLFVENGRIQDEPGRNFKTGLREIAKVHKGTFRNSANQHICISDVATEDLPLIKRLLAEYKLDNLEHSGLRLSSSACVAFPTCGLAMAESERYLPVLIDKVEKICEENGLRNDSIVMRMTGCPNGCARPYVAEIAFVGKSLGTYLMLLGGGYHGQRLNKIYRESVTEPEILAILKPMIKRYALERYEGEHFGDWVIRAGYISATTEGKAWYDGLGGEGEHRVVASS